MRVYLFVYYIAIQVHVARKVYSAYIAWDAAAWMLCKMRRISETGIYDEVFVFGA